jgi:hypothetical protein
MTREELKAKLYVGYAEKSNSKEYPGVLMFYMTKENNLKTSVIPTNLTEEEFYQKLTDVELGEDFKGYIGEEFMETITTNHYSKKGMWGQAIDRVIIDHEGYMWVSNGEYATKVNYCPFTGEKAFKTLTQSEKEYGDKIDYYYNEQLR